MGHLLMKKDEYRRKTLQANGKEVLLPAFFPDGTNGAVRCVDGFDLDRAGVDGVVVNTYHIMDKPGAGVIKDIGGLHKFMHWGKVVLTDSGGFQVFSLIKRDPSLGAIRDKEVIFKSAGQKLVLTPEKCIQVQFGCRSDIMMCLDYCTHPDDSYEENKKAVELTCSWAKKCKVQYESMVVNSKTYKPLIFGIIQGGSYKDLRDQCAQHLMQIGFDGFGFGGWPIDKNGMLIEDILYYTAELIPDNLIKYAMGIGKPENIVKCAQMGYDLFDCVIPTREARHGKLYVYNASSLEQVDITDDFYHTLYITDDKFIRDESPVSQVCDCFCCRNFSKAYLHHLFKTGETLALRLATIHNIRFYTQLMEIIRRKLYGY